MSRGRRSKKKTQNNKLNLEVAILLIASVLLAILIYTRSGYIGENLSPILGGIMGWIKYIIPVGTFIVAIFIAKEEDKEEFLKIIIEYAILLLCISTIITVLQASRGKINLYGNFEKVVKDAYYQGTQNEGGGAVGAACAIGLSKLLGNAGAIIASIGIALIDCIFLFGVEPARILKDSIEKREERKKELQEERKQSRIHDLENEEKSDNKKSKLFGNKNEENPITEDQIKINISGIPDEKHENTLFKKEEEQKEDKSKEVLVLEHTLTVEDENYEFPPIDLLKKGKPGSKKGEKAVIETANKLKKTLYSFGVSAKVENVSVGPAIIRYELKPAEGVRVNKIANLADDIALNLAAESIRIEAPIPGKQAVRNRNTK